VTHPTQVDQTNIHMYKISTLVIQQVGLQYHLILFTTWHKARDNRARSRQTNIKQDPNEMVSNVQQAAEYIYRRLCSDFMDMLRHLISCRIIIIKDGK